MPGTLYGIHYYFQQKHDFLMLYLFYNSEKSRSFSSDRKSKQCPVYLCLRPT